MAIIAHSGRAVRGFGGSSQRPAGFRPLRRLVRRLSLPDWPPRRVRQELQAQQRHRLWPLQFLHSYQPVVLQQPPSGRPPQLYRRQFRTRPPPRHLDTSRFLLVRLRLNAELPFQRLVVERQPLALYPLQSPQRFEPPEQFRRFGRGEYLLLPSHQELCRLPSFHFAPRQAWPPRPGLKIQDYFDTFENYPLLLVFRASNCPHLPLKYTPVKDYSKNPKIYRPQKPFCRRTLPRAARGARAAWRRVWSASPR